MTDTKFKEGMAMMCEIYGREITDLLLKSYWMVLKGLSDEQFEKAVTDVISSRVYSSMPLPAEIIGKVLGDQPLQAWLESRKPVAIHGAYMSIRYADPVIHSVIEAMGGWPTFCYITDEEKPFKQRDFERLYKLMAEKKEHPDYVCGTHEQGLVDLTGDETQVIADHKNTQLRIKGNDDDDFTQSVRKIEPSR